MIEKGIFFGLSNDGVITFNDVPMLLQKGFKYFYVTGDKVIRRVHNYNKLYELGVRDFIVDVKYSFWKEVVDLIDARYYYIDEPFSNTEKKLDYQVTIVELLEIQNYIKKKRPNSDLILGDTYPLLRDYFRPLDFFYYTYTDYKNNILINNKPTYLGLGNQSKSIRKIYKKTPNIPFIWMYGRDKLFCHPDEYHKLFNTCRELNIKLAMLYVPESIIYSKYNINRETTLKYINDFANERKPYTFFEWWSKFFKRLIKSLF